LAFCPVAQQRVRHLDQAAGAVANQWVGADRTAMVEIDQDLQAALDDVVRFSPFDIGDETDAAGIMLVARIVVRGEILRPAEDKQMRRHSTRMFSLIKNES